MPDRPRYLFVTGKLAEHGLREVVSQLSRERAFDYEICVLGISVAALMSVDWVARKLPRERLAGITQVYVPGWTSGDIETLQAALGLPVIRGPKDVYDLPLLFGAAGRPPLNELPFSIEILAEINHAPQMAFEDLLAISERYRASGADVIDLGAVPDQPWPEVGRVVRDLVARGFRLSIDSFDEQIVRDAVEAGAELVLSASEVNAGWAKEVPAEFVVIPHQVSAIDSMITTRDVLHQAGRKTRLDPVLNPIGFGFAESLARYRETRLCYPDDRMLMGIGNVTELSEVDSAGVNFLLAALCEEWRIDSILTTEVINWCRTSVREFDIARRLVRFAITNSRIPKHIDGSLVMLRDRRLRSRGAESLEEMQRQIRDPNFRIFAERGELHVMNRDGYWHGDDPYEVFDRIVAAGATFSPEHAFYLGYELCKGRTALTLGKQYVQDEALRWGCLTTEEVSANDRRRADRAKQRGQQSDTTDAEAVE